MPRNINNYFHLLDSELKNSALKVRQKNDALNELGKVRVAIMDFVQQRLNKEGICEIDRHIPLCAVSRLASGGETYILSLRIKGDESRINLMTMTFSKQGAYPCTLRTGQDAYNCATAAMLQKMLKETCKLICFFILEHVQKSKEDDAQLGQNFAHSAGELGANPAETGGMPSVVKKSRKKAMR